MSSTLSDKVARIHSDLREEILKGKWEAGSNLPRELELAKRFGCSAGTVNKAVTLLVHEGLVVRRNRMGTRVVRNSIQRKNTGLDLDAFAFIYPSEKHEGIWRTVQGFQEAAGQNGRRVVMLAIGADYFKEVEYLGRLSEFDVRGAAIYPYVPSPTDQVRISQRIVESQFPVVLVDQDFPGLGCNSVVVDGFHAGYVMTRYLIEQGLERVGFFSDNTWASSVIDRYHGYRWALDEAGMAFKSTRVFLKPTMEPDFEDPLRQPEALGQHFLGYTDCDGVLAANDFMARGLIRAAKAKGMSVPAQLKVVGIDDFSSGVHEAPGLTTYRVPFEQIGREVFNVLNARTSGEILSELETRVRGAIVVRESA